MCKVIKISDYSPICMTSPYTARTVLSDISNMKPSDNEVVIDFDGMISMSCQCINAIFGELVKQIGVEKFEKNLIFKNLSDGLKSLILMIVNEKLK